MIRSLIHFVFIKDKWFNRWNQGLKHEFNGAKIPPTVQKLCIRTWFALSVHLVLIFHMMVFA